MEKRLISIKKADHIAWLARVELSDNERAVFTKQFNEILDYFRKIDDANTEDVPPAFHVLDLVNIFREDEVSPSLPIEKALGNAPKKEKQFFKAPRIV